MAKVLLINPSDAHVDGCLKGGVWHAPPLGIAYIASVLESEGHDVRIIDFSIESINLINFCSQFNPDVIGISCTTPTLNNSLLIAKTLKNTFHKIPIVFGGVHPTIFAKQLLKEDFIDFVVFGEGELTMAELISHLKIDYKFNEIKGLCYKKNEEIIRNEPRPLIENLDDLPFPSRHLLNIYKYPNHPSSKRKPSTTILTSRGCPGMCIFCDKNVFGRTFRTRSVENVLDELELLMNEYSMKEMAIIDDTFTLNKKRVVNICKGILERGLDISWLTPNGVRVDTINNEVAYWMKKSGCHLLIFGIESGNQKTLNIIRKGITINQIKKAVEICKKFGIDVGGFFMVGLPNETQKDIEKTINFAKSLKLDITKFGITVPLPGTELYGMLKGNITEMDFSKYFWHKEPVFETNELSKKKMLILYKKAYKQFYFNPMFLLKKLIKMNSAMEIKNNLNGLTTVITAILSE